MAPQIEGSKKGKGPKTRLPGRAIPDRSKRTWDVCVKVKLKKRIRTGNGGNGGNGWGLGAGGYEMSC